MLLELSCGCSRRRRRKLSGISKRKHIQLLLTAAVVQAIVTRLVVPPPPPRAAHHSHHLYFGVAVGMCIVVDHIVVKYHFLQNVTTCTLLHIAAVILQILNQVVATPPTCITFLLVAVDHHLQQANHQLVAVASSIHLQCVVEGFAGPLQ